MKNSAKLRDDSKNRLRGNNNLLTHQDIRERKGSFFTPQIWVELSQRYLADVFGENWQDKYYVWDCCAGTGNLLVGINRKPENVFASTIDDSDVKAMHDRIDNGARLLKKNVFQFDFLNDSFTSGKVPKALKEILQDSKKRKKLIIYINPPYAEVSTVTGRGKKGVNISETHTKYTELLGTAGRELYTQFLLRIRLEIKGFSKEAKDVFNAGKEIWKYYHSFPRVDANASLYDIKTYFQGSKDGRMNNKSTDEDYNKLISNLREKLKILASVIEPKVYEYGFLKK